jgi:alpha-methylacyl-CoA racemase
VLYAEGTPRDERGVNVLESGAPLLRRLRDRGRQVEAVGAIEPQFYGQLVKLLSLADLPDRDDRSN